MSSKNNDSSSRKTPTTIKIAAQDASKRASSSGGAAADPGPGDLSAAPSVAPELVTIPSPPTPSQLVVKSTNSQAQKTNLLTLAEGRSGTLKSAAPVSHHSGSQGANPPAPAAREPTSSKPLTGPPGGGSTLNEGPSREASAGFSKGASAMSGLRGSSAASGPRGASAAMSKGASGMAHSTAAGTGAFGSHKTLSQPEPVSGPKSIGSGAENAASGAPPVSNLKSEALSPSNASEGGVVHDEDEVGEGELEHPEGEASPSPAASSMQQGSIRGSSQAAEATQPQISDLKSSSKSSGNLHESSKSAGASQAASSIPASSKSSSPTGSKSGHKSSSSFGGSSDSSKSGKDKKKKVTRFRYHKRITVRTTGKTSPSDVMDKVNKKDHKTHITPSTIEDLDPQELMKRAGIKGNKQTHWRVRLRQTKRVTKNGKTTTQTKVAYRDSEGNKRIKTSSNPNCKKCGKKLESCKCDTNSSS